MSSGCPSDAEIAALQQAAPGQAPAALAQHLASCERCQSRALFGAARAKGPQREPPRPPSLGRTLFLLAAVLLALGVFAWSLRRLAG